MLHWFYIISLPSKERQVRAENKQGDLIRKKEDDTGGKDELHLE